MPLHLRPDGLRLVEHGNLRHVVQPQQGDSPAAARVHRYRDDDAAQPADEGIGVLQVVEAAERPQVGLLHGILGRRMVAQDAGRNGVRRRLRRLDDLPVRSEVTAPRPLDEFPQWWQPRNFPALMGKDTGSFRS